MEEMDRTDPHQLQIDKDDYIDIPKFIRTMVRFVCHFWYFVLPLILIMTVCIALYSKIKVKKQYIAGGTFMVGVQLSGSSSYNYTFSENPSTAYYTLIRMTSILNGITASEYLDQLVMEDLNLEEGEELNGTVSFDIPYGTNLVALFVTSDEAEDAEEIRDAVFSHLPELLYSSMGYVELDVKEWYTKEEDPDKEYLTYPAVWIALGLFLGCGAYLGIIFLYTLIYKAVETPEDIRNITALPCLGQLPALRRRLIKSKNRESAGLVVTESYKEAFADFRRALFDKVTSRNLRVLLFTGCDRRAGKSFIIDRLKTAWTGQGKRVAVTDYKPEYGPQMEEKIQKTLHDLLESTDLILIDASSYKESVDSLLLADYADAVVCVVKEGVTRESDLKDLVQSMQFARAPFLGCILNSCDYLPFTGKQ